MEELNTCCVCGTRSIYGHNLEDEFICFGCRKEGYDLAWLDPKTKKEVVITKKGVKIVK